MGLKPKRYVDSNVLIYAAEREDELGERARLFIVSDEVLFTSELTEMECLVMPLRNADFVLIGRYERIFARIERIPVSSQVLKIAAQLRADYRSLRTPDAIHAATALELGCTEFMTNDPAFVKVEKLIVRAP